MDEERGEEYGEAVSDAEDDHVTGEEEFEEVLIEDEVTEVEGDESMDGGDQSMDGDADNNNII